MEEAVNKGTAAKNKKEPPGNRVDAAYDAIQMMCFACLAVENYRTTSEHGHHAELLEAICERIGASQGLADRLEAVMEARNRKYSGASRSERDAEDAEKAMSEFLDLATPWLAPKAKKVIGSGQKPGPR